jgi:hypothetical protein
VTIWCLAKPENGLVTQVDSVQLLLLNIHDTNFNVIARAVNLQVTFIIDTNEHGNIKSNKRFPSGKTVLFYKHATINCPTYHLSCEKPHMAANNQSYRSQKWRATCLSIAHPYRTFQGKLSFTLVIRPHES